FLVFPRHPPEALAVSGRGNMSGIDWKAVIRAGYNPATPTSDRAERRCSAARGLPWSAASASSARAWSSRGRQNGAALKGSGQRCGLPGGGRHFCLLSAGERENPMSDTDRGADSSLPLDAERRIDAVCLRFEAALQAGASPRLEDFVSEMVGPPRL